MAEASLGFLRGLTSNLPILISPVLMFRNLHIPCSCFDIEEGDFFKHRQHEVQRVLSRQFGRLYADGMVDKGEAVHNVYLQEIFGLSYDQFDAFKAEAVNNALKQGADITDLDTASNPPKQ